MKKINLYKSAFVGSFILLISNGLIAQSPTAPAQGFNIFTENSLTPKTNESEGPIATGGNLIVDGNYSVSVHSGGSFNVGGIPIGLLVQGQVNYVGGSKIHVLNNAYVKIGNGTGSHVWYFDQNNAASPMRITPNANYNASPRIEMSANSNQLGVGVNNNPIFQSNLIDFGSAFSTMRSTSTNMSQCEHNVVIKNANGQVIPNTNLPNQIRIQLQDGLNVWNVSAADLANIQVLNYDNQPNASRYLVINVNTSGTFNWNIPNQTGVGFAQCPFILYNFFNTNTLILNGATLEGTVFAPFADVDKPGQSNIEGQMISKSFIQRGGEMHYAVFTPDVQGCSTAPVVPPTAAFTIDPSIQCLNGNQFLFQNTSTSLGCPTLSHQIFNSATDAENAFNSLYFSAEGRSGNNALNGTFELDIHHVNPYSILSSNQFVWPNNENVPFTITYDPNAVGNNKFIYTVGVGAAQQIMQLDPEAAGYPTDINALWFYSRTPANTTLMVSDVYIDGTPINMNLGHANPAQTAFTNVAFTGTTLQDGFQITGNVKFAWSGVIPQNSNMNFNFKIGNMDCVPQQVNQPGLMSYHWDFGDGSTSTLMNPSKTYAFPGTYTVTLTATNSDGSATFSTNVTVVSPVTPSVSQVNLSSGNGSLVRQFTLNNAASFDAYSWTDQNGNSGLFPNESTVTFTFNQAGYHSILLVAEDSLGCSISMAMTFSVSSEQVNGGNDGGIESESLGDAVSKVYVNRKKNSIPTVFEKTDDLIFVKPMAVRTNEQQLIDMFPTSLAAGSVAHITSPTDILDYTIAQEVLSVDFSLDGKTKAVVLGVKTIDKVYNHTKASCDRLRGAEILAVEQVDVHGYSFLMQALKQRNDVIEYAISFAVGKNQNDDNYSLQTNWLASNYNASDEVFNFQVWSVDPVYTVKLLEDILNNLSLDIVHLDEAVVPKTYVSKVSRETFDLVLQLKSTQENQSVEVFMEENYSETHGFALRYNPITTQFNQELRINIKDGYEYQGLLKTNGIAQDEFYHGDGNWGLDFDPSYTLINNYKISNNFDREWNAEEWLIHRNVSLSLYSDDYLTLYKSLLPANLPADYSDYKYLSFTAKGSGLLELGLIKTSIQEWKHQFRANIMTRSFEQTFYVPFDYFRSTGSNNTIIANDLSTLTFTLLPAEIGQENLNLEIEDVKFTKTAPEVYEELLVTMQDAFIAYPNPSNGEITTVVYSNAPSTVNVRLHEITGKMVYTAQVNLEEGRNELAFDFAAHATGVMFLSITSDVVNYGTMKMIFK